MLTPLTVDSSNTPLSTLAGGATLGSFATNGLQQAQINALNNFQQKQEDVRASSAEREAALNRETDRFIKVKAQINNAAVAIDNGLESLDEIETKINEMKALLGDIERESTSEFYRDEYDEKLREINLAADIYSQAFNPIGRVQDRLTWEPNTITYRPDFTSTEVELEGVYAGSDFNITADDGTIWIPDLQASTLEQYTSYNSEIPEDSDSTGAVTSTLNGITDVTGPDGDGKYTFTILNGGTEETITGTLSQGGLQIMGSWFHGNLDTEADRLAALEELNAADAELTFARAQLERHRTTIELDDRQVDEQLDLVRDDQRDNLFDQLEAETALQTEFQQQVEALARNVEAISAQQVSYRSIFAGFLNTTNNPLFLDTSV
ncbi:MAG: hypothetical protein ACPGOY_01930 [Rhodospirillaceae bacterium]